MKVVVQKYGGSSVATVEAIRKVARRVVAKREEGWAVVVVVSAMGDTTDELLELAREVAPDPPRRELDLLLGTGELRSVALLSMALEELGAKAVALSGRQCGIVTNDVHLNARILEIRPQRIRDELAAGRTVVAAGFQGISPRDDLTTLGRGGSDLTAVALAAALEAEVCEILSDVEGVMSADPRVVERPRLLQGITHNLVEEFAWHGARVLKSEAVELASDHDIRLRVASTFNSREGTLVETNPAVFRPKGSEYMGVAGRKDLLRISFQNPERAFPKALFERLAQYDLIFGNVNDRGAPCKLFLSIEEIPNVEAFVHDLQTDPPAAHLTVSEVLGAVTLVGFGLGSRPAALSGALQALDEAKIEVLESFTGHESLTFVVPTAKVDDGMRILHRRYLENDTASPAKRSD